MQVIDRIMKLEREAESIGFRWENPAQIMDQIESECQEIRAELGDQARIEYKGKLQEEIGDLFHAVFSLCAFCGLDPAETLTQTTDKFERRLKAVQQIAKDQGYVTLEGLPFAKLMEIWSQAKTIADVHERQ